MSEEFNDNIVKVWYNTEKKWYECYMPDGTKIPKQVECIVNDRFDEPTKCSISMFCEVVNEKPRQKA